MSNCFCHFNGYEVKDATAREGLDLANARLGNLVANSGEQTEGNTELIDIRTGADGTVYPTAGDSVREQITDLKSDLVQLNTDNFCVGGNLFNSLGYKKRYSTGYDSTTKIPRWTEDATKKQYTFTIPKNGVVELSKPNIQGSQMYLLSAEGKVIGNNVITEVTENGSNYLNYTLTVTDTNLILDCFTAHYLGGEYVAVTYAITDDCYCKPSNYGMSENIDTKASSDIKMVLPKKIYGVVGLETNVYFDNLLANTRLNGVSGITCDASGSDFEILKDRLVWNPSTSGSKTVTFRLYKHSKTVCEQEESVEFIASPTTAGSGRSKNVLVIGDSKVASNYVTHFLTENGNTDESLSITCIGTKGNWGEIRHEGRNGWTAKDFNEVSTKNGVDNGFYNGAFDFAYYMSNSGIARPDYVFINLGTNDSSQYDENAFVTYLDKMVTSIRAYDGNIIIVIGLCEGVCTASYTADHVNKNDILQEYHRETIRKFYGKEGGKIYLCPMYVSMDLENDYEYTEVPLSKRDESRETDKTRRKISDTVHQSSVGYYKNADMMYSLIKYLENK